MKVELNDEQRMKMTWMINSNGDNNNDTLQPPSLSFLDIIANEGLTEGRKDGSRYSVTARKDFSPY